MLKYLYKKFINDGLDGKTALRLAKKIRLRSITDEKCRKCQSKKCFNGEYGLFCPEGRPSY